MSLEYNDILEKYANEKARADRAERSLVDERRRHESEKAHWDGDRIETLERLLAQARPEMRAYEVHRLRPEDGRCSIICYPLMHSVFWGAEGDK